MTVTPTICPLLTASRMTASSAFARCHRDRTTCSSGTAALDSGLRSAVVSPPIEAAMTSSRRDTVRVLAALRDADGFIVDSYRTHEQYPSVECTVSPSER